MSPTIKEPLEKSYLCHHWGKYHVKNLVFSLESAHQLLVSLQGKKADHSIKAKLSAYQSAFKLSKKGAFRGGSEKIPYVTIQRFFVFKIEPHLIFLGVEKRKRLSYIVILFRDVKEVNEVCDLIERKKGGVIRETDHHIESEIAVCHEKSQEQEPEVVVCYERTIEEQPKLELVSHQTQSEPMEEKVVYISSKETYTIPVVKPNVEYHFEERHTDDMGTTKIDALLVRTDRSNIDSEQWHEDMKYLEYNPVKGTATETDVGPIYMYTAHFTPADYNHFGTCESDSDSCSGQSEDSKSKYDNRGKFVKKKDDRTAGQVKDSSRTGYYM